MCVPVLLCVWAVVADCVVVALVCMSVVLVLCGCCCVLSLFELGVVVVCVCSLCFVFVLVVRVRRCRLWWRCVFVLCGCGFSWYVVVCFVCFVVDVK